MATKNMSPTTGSALHIGGAGEGRGSEGAVAPSTCPPALRATLWMGGWTKRTKYPLVADVSKKKHRQPNLLRAEGSAPNRTLPEVGAEGPLPSGGTQPTRRVGGQGAPFLRKGGASVFSFCAMVVVSTSVHISVLLSPPPRRRRRAGPKAPTSGAFDPRARRCQLKAHYSFIINRTKLWEPLADEGPPSDGRPQGPGRMMPQRGIGADGAEGRARARMRSVLHLGCSQVGKATVFDIV